MKRRAFTILVALALILALGMQVGWSEENQEEGIAVDTKKIIHKLDEVLANQAEILKQFEGLKQELEVIKIRASR